MRCPLSKLLIVLIIESVILICGSLIKLNDILIVNRLYIQPGCVTTVENYNFNGFYPGFSFTCIDCGFNAFVILLYAVKERIIISHCLDEARTVMREMVTGFG